MKRRVVSLATYMTVQRVTFAAMLCAAIATGPKGVFANDETYSHPDIEEIRGFVDGARAMMCNEIGFMSFVWGIDDELRSPQFPGAKVQYADGLIALTDDHEINGIKIQQSAYLTFLRPGQWSYSGYRSTQPVSDTCVDITSALEESFVDLALAASWGMPKVRERVRVFDLLEDDLRTRLELARHERDEIRVEAAALRNDLAGLETELATARMAVCEIASHTRDLLVQASSGTTSHSAPEGFFATLAEVDAFDDCLSEAIFVTSRRSKPQ